MTNFDVIKTLHPRQFSLVLPFILEFRKMNGHLGLSNWLESDIDEKFWFEEQEILQLKQEDYIKKSTVYDTCNLNIILDEACKKCGSHNYKLRYVKPHTGIYCNCCGSYIRWLSKAEKREYRIITPEDVRVTGNKVQVTILDDLKDDDGEVPF